MSLGEVEANCRKEIQGRKRALISRAWKWRIPNRLLFWWVCCWLSWSWRNLALIDYFLLFSSMKGCWVEVILESVEIHCPSAWYYPPVNRAIQTLATFLVKETRRLQSELSDPVQEETSLMCFSPCLEYTKSRKALQNICIKGIPFSRSEITAF